MRPRTRAWWSLAVCLLVLVGAPAAWSLSRAPANAGIDPSVVAQHSETAASGFSSAGTAPKVSTPGASRGAGSPTTGATQSSRLRVAIPVSDAALTSQAAAVPPARLRIPAIGVNSSVVGVGVRSDGQIEIPEDPSQIGWYRYGSAPGGSSGSAVLVGHRDSRRYGAGALYSLASVGPGDTITVILANGRRVAYNVVSRRLYPKQVLPLGLLFARDGAPRLTLITCGGDYVAGRGYADNVVITAEPVVPPAASAGTPLASSPVAP